MRLGLGALACGLGLLWGGAALAFLRAAPGVLPVEPAAAPTVKKAPSLVVAKDRFYDPGNPDFSLLQKPQEALDGLPLDKQGRVDWSAALLNGLITPRGSLHPNAGAEADLLDLDIIMRNTRAMPHVRFSHLAHTRWLACSNCHPNPFPYQAGTTGINMTAIFRGKYCGMCHDRVAFMTWQSCERCHSVPRGKQPR